MIPANKSIARRNNMTPTAPRPMPSQYVILLAHTFESLKAKTEATRNSMPTINNVCVIIWSR